MPYGYRRLKIFTSLSLRFQNFQRKSYLSSYVTQVQAGELIQLTSHRKAAYKLQDYGKSVSALVLENRGCFYFATPQL